MQVLLVAVEPALQYETPVSVAAENLDIIISFQKNFTTNKKTSDPEASLFIKKVISFLLLPVLLRVFVQ